MISVLFMIAKGHESPSLVSELLDQSKFKHKPVYAMASEEPLVLYECGFREPLQVCELLRAINGRYILKSPSSLCRAACVSRY